MTALPNWQRSPPARVAWIEIGDVRGTNEKKAVATREGGVDRNNELDEGYDTIVTSPPARVAWIEIEKLGVNARAKVSPPARVAWIET